MEYLMQTLTDIVHAAITIAVWELFAKDFITWDGFGTPFRRKNRKPNAKVERPQKASKGENA